jgi:hypothetical protein
MECLNFKIITTKEVGVITRITIRMTTAASLRMMTLKGVVIEMTQGMFHDRRVMIMLYISKYFVSIKSFLNRWVYVCTYNL